MERDHDAANDYDDKQKHDEQTDPQPQLFADHRENEIGVSVGKVEHFLPAVSETESIHPAAAPCDQRLHLLQSSVFFIALEICERDEALHPRVRRANENHTGTDDREQAE